MGAANATVREHKVLHGGPKQFRNLFRVEGSVAQAQFACWSEEEGRKGQKKQKKLSQEMLSAKARGQCQPAKRALEHGREEIRRRKEMGRTGPEMMSQRGENRESLQVDGVSRGRLGKICGGWVSEAKKAHGGPKRPVSTSRGGCPWGKSTQRKGIQQGG